MASTFPAQSRHGRYARTMRAGRMCYNRAMRYVIVIAAFAFFLGWDLTYNQGHYVDIGVRAITHAVRAVTG